MFIQWHIPDEWPSEQQEILRRLQQPPNSHTSTTLLATTELLYLSHLVRPDDETFLEKSRRFRAEKNGAHIHIECINARIYQRVEARRSDPNKKHPYVCVVCQTSGRTIWRIPDKPDNEQFDYIGVIWYELPP